MAAAAFMVVASDMKENERAFIFSLFSKTLLLNSNFGRQDTCDNEDF
jgi:hypothetical protein